LAGPLDLAESFFERTQGLLGREALVGRTGMVFPRCGMIHTCFMRFPIDVVFLGRDGTVLKVGHRVKPYRIAAALFAHKTVEIPAGLAETVALAKGQHVELREAKEEGP
jgi:uncharacterized membrane protein (UPF0127 family)